MQCQRRLQISRVKNIGSGFDLSGIAGVSPCLTLGWASCYISSRCRINSFWSGNCHRMGGRAQTLLEPGSLNNTNQWKCGQMATDRAKLCRPIDRYTWEVVGGLSIGTTHDPHNSPLTYQTPQIEDPKTPPLIADGATLWIDRRCEVIAVVLMHQNIQWIRIEVCRLTNLSSTSAAVFTQFVGFSCSFEANRQKLVIFNRNVFYISPFVVRCCEDCV